MARCHLRLVHPLVTQHDPYRYDDLVIHDRHAVVVPFHWDRNSDTRVVEVSKDHLVSATLDVEMTGYPPLTGIRGEYEVNGSKIVSFIWEIWESGARKSKLGVDVKALLRHGTNEFTAWAYKAYMILESSVVFTTTLHLYYEWAEGETPPPVAGPPKPPPTWWEELFEKLKEYTPWIIGGVVVVGGVFIAYELVKKRS